MLCFPFIINMIHFEDPKQISAADRWALVKQVGIMPALNTYLQGFLSQLSLS